MKYEADRKENQEFDIAQVLGDRQQRCVIRTGKSQGLAWHDAFQPNRTWLGLYETGNPDDVRGI